MVQVSTVQILWWASVKFDMTFSCSNQLKVAKFKT